ncbi:hypothetical protein [Geomonas ferrireducens]|nr:hypothetical protein [Geomonas ferrireducens]
MKTATNVKRAVLDIDDSVAAGFMAYDRTVNGQSLQGICSVPFMTAALFL